MRVAAPIGIWLALQLLVLGMIAWEDFQHRRIPNPLVLVLLLGGFIHAALGRGVLGLGIAAAGVAVGFLAMVLQYRLGWMGAGDVKLLASLGAWSGPLGVLYLLLAASLLGGVLALVSLLRLGRSERAHVRHNLAGLVLTHRLDPPSLASQRRGIPYGVAIAAAAMAMFLYGGF